MATINARKGPDANNKLVIIGWQAIIRKQGHPSQTRTFRTKRDAEAWAKVTESEMLRGSGSTAPKQRAQRLVRLSSDMPMRYPSIRKDRHKNCVGYGNGWSGLSPNEH